ncbi:aminotransferase class I/II-fold pyridoxal phosphate-dependent enzyme [Fodinicola feengrottensis]|uniref:aminotransferase class I/II-fold pyridoxal phosphate-dependent enzyme n=1 Tax=Fodinicola feengrottensis TaxID=435914 RepID=UPI0024429A88|nr:aminotransferase class I/II-fold pyridoxal phosphate-dependent enzyme [Fodinicola feengrottensis]
MGRFESGAAAAPGPYGGVVAALPAGGRPPGGDPRRPVAGPGALLPSSRELARMLGVSRGLVQECFGQLQAEGYLTTRVGSATRVAEGAWTTPVTAAAAAAPPRLIADFRHGVPDLASFPRGDWLWAQKEICREMPNAALDYGDPRGILELREVLASYLGRVRGAAAEPSRMVVCTGFAQGLNLVLRALVQKGIQRIAFEDPGYDEDGVAYRQKRRWALSPYACQSTLSAWTWKRSRLPVRTRWS